jgi:hypothetical protein
LDRTRICAVTLLVCFAASGPAGAQTTAPYALGETRFKFDPPFEDPTFVHGPSTPPKKNYLIPLGELVFIDTAIWAWNYVQGKEFAKISWESIKHNFHKGWIIDTDDFWANQILHPLHGNLSFTAARSMGLNFYESFGYAFLGSLAWEQFYEIQPPSMNDQVNTPFGGSLLGEALYRLSRIVLDGGGYYPSSTRQLFAFLLAPAPGLNRLMFHDEYRNGLLLPPSWLAEFRFGALIAGTNKNAATGAKDITVGPWFSTSTDIVYGVPGSPDLELEKPFDHFTLTASFSLTSDVTDHASMALLIRGLLLGETLHFDESFGGLWGLFTSYDFIAPQTFRVGGFGFGPGVTLAKRWGSFQLDTTVDAEFLPWAGGGTTIPLGVRDYHYGPGADGAIELRGQFGDRVTARLDAREYWITGAYARGSSEDMSYVRALVTVRVYGQSAFTVGTDFAYREATYPDQPRIWQRGSSLSVYYTLLSGW